MNYFHEQKAIHFPEIVTVTEQDISTKDFSHEWKDAVISLAQDILMLYIKQGKERFVVVLGGPSGSSKSTMAAVLEKILNDIQSQTSIIVVGQDGYHFTQEYLLKTEDDNGEPLANHKGRYDSFDTKAIEKDIKSFCKGEEISFPLYSRKIHNPISSAISCKEGPCLMILEGLWLLYNEKPWNGLLSMYDYSIFVHASPEIRKSNTIKRHLRGHEHTSSEAEFFYDTSDTKNAELINAKISPHEYDFYYSKNKE